MSFFLSSHKNLHIRRFLVQLTQGPKRGEFSVLAEDPTRAVLTCIESEYWRTNFKRESSELKYTVRAAMSDEISIPLELAAEVDKNAVWQYNKALTSAPLVGSAKYTVFGTYPDCDDRYAGPVQASDATEAMLRAIENWRERNEEEWVRVEFCGLALGDCIPADVAYATPGWNRGIDSEYYGSDSDELEIYTVISNDTTAVVKATNPLVAESEFDSNDVAAVLLGAVDNLWWAVDNFLLEWSLGRSSRASAKLLRSDILKAEAPPL